MGVRTATILLVIVLVTLACGGGGDFDDSGLISGSDDCALFTRASQQYFRGALSTSRESFSSLVSTFPGSPFMDDAQLAIRSIDSDLSARPDTSSVIENPVREEFPSLAIVGTPAAASAMSALETMFTERGCYPRMIEDPDAPGMTLILYPDGSLVGAQVLADSVASWLISHGSVTVQPGGNVLPTVAPGHDGVVLVVGTDAVVQSVRPGTNHR